MARTKHWRERKAQDLKRRKGARPPYPRVLIVCEGSKTEPLYFNDIRRLNRVPSARIKVIPADGTQPLQIVECARRTFDEDGKEYDYVFSVFDRDDHITYHNALGSAAALNGKLHNDEHKPVIFLAVPSVPCFELWLLLHFDDVFAFQHRQEIFDQLRTHVRAYSKGSKGVYASLEPSLPAAVQRAGALRARFNPFSGDDPYTLVDEVVGLLRSIRA